MRAPEIENFAVCATGERELLPKIRELDSEIFQKFKQVYGDEDLVRTAVFKWHARFVQEKGSFEDNVRTDQPTTVRTEPVTEEVETLVRADRSQSVYGLAAALGISQGMCHKILSDNLNMLHNTVFHAS